MNTKLNIIIIILPILFILNVLEEYFMGFVQWHRDLLNSDLSNTEFLIINGVAFLIIDSNTMLHFIKRGSNFVTAVIGTLLAINGLLNVLLSIITTSYAPGTITGIILYLPLGILMFYNIFPLLSDTKRKNAIIFAILLHLAIIVLSINM